jgi:hypothetical protein
MRLAFLTLVTVAASGCGLMGDGVVVYGTPEGIRAFYDGQNALIANAKTTDRKGDSAAWQHRRAEEREITTRRSFMDKLLYGFVEPTTTTASETTEVANEERY